MEPLIQTPDGRDDAGDARDFEPFGCAGSREELDANPTAALPVRIGVARSAYLRLEYAKAVSHYRVAPRLQPLAKEEAQRAANFSSSWHGHISGRAGWRRRGTAASRPQTCAERMEIRR